MIKVRFNDQSNFTMDILMLNAERSTNGGDWIIENSLLYPFTFNARFSCQT
jgi:hypothetical protein